MMKFWQKTFLILFVLFIICLNGSIFFLATATYKKELDVLKDKSIGEAYFIASSLSNDISTLQASNTLNSDVLEHLFYTYSDYYKDKGVSLCFIQDGSILFNDLPDHFLAVTNLCLAPNTQELFVKEIQGTKYMYVSTSLPYSFSNDLLIYSSNLSAFDNTWKQLVFLFISTSLITSCLLALALYLTLNNLTKPLNALTRATAELASGTYKSPLLIKGEDEFAKLSRCFNEMAQSIDEKIEALSISNEKKQRLVDNLAHELRTPLTSISGYTEYMQRAVLTEEQRYNCLEYIAQESKRLSRLSTVLLRLADLKESEIPMESIPLAPLMLHLKQLFEEKLTHKNIALITYVQVDAMVGNKELVESLFINLIENAIRASFTDSTITITISSHEAQRQIEITIQDQGIGIDEESLKHLSEPFYRVDKARSRKNGGVGLGVTLCEQIISVHHAEMHYDSIVDQGTTVTITWPFKIFD